MHCKVWMQLNYRICTSSTDYLYCLLAYDMLHSHSMCHFHTQPVLYCKPMQDHVTQLHQSLMLKLALFPGSQSAVSVGTASDQLPLNLCIHSLFHHQQSNYINSIISSATIWSGQEIDYTQAFPNCGRHPSRNSRARSQACPVFCSSVLHSITCTQKCWVPCSILIANQRTKNGETWELGYNKPSSNNLLGAIGDILYKYHLWAYFRTFNFLSHDAVICAVLARWKWTDDFLI